MPVDGIGTDTSTAKYGGGIIQVVQNFRSDTGSSSVQGGLLST